MNWIIIIIGSLFYDVFSGTRLYSVDDWWWWLMTDISSLLFRSSGFGSTHQLNMRFGVVTVVKIPIFVFRIVTPCDLEGRPTFWRDIHSSSSGTNRYIPGDQQQRQFNARVIYLFSTTTWRTVAMKIYIVTWSNFVNVICRSTKTVDIVLLTKEQRDGKEKRDKLNKTRHKDKYVEMNMK
jgi:hypothetical protein